MKKRTKWILITIGATIAIPILAAVAILLFTCRKPNVEPIPEAYLHAKQIWSSESGKAEIDLKVSMIVATIDVINAPICGTTIKYPDEKEARDIYPLELYFGASNIKFDELQCIIYVKVAGSNPVCGRYGERIFEYDARRRLPVRDYWVNVSN